MKRTLSIALVALIGSASAVAAADMSGQWAVAADLGGTAVNSTCTFKQTGNSFDGTCKGDGGDSKTSGTVDNQKVTFKYSVDAQGMTYALTYVGTLDQAGAELKGNVTVAGAADAEGMFTAKKQ